ncbi:MAG TPA: hypothetical protein VN880_14610 [Solirubrobacteraceae bacterium]|nr:hypothetical protein [Solirubrobacteraceae bacterium]
MSRLHLRGPSPALVVSVVALVVALGGTSYAAFSLPKNSVGSKQLKKNAVTTSKIKNNAVTTSKIKNGSVTASKINTSGLTVPNAQNANHANSADSATNAANAANATNATNANNATTVGGKQVKQFFVNDPASTANTAVLTVDGVTINGGCDAGTNPQLTIQNDSGKGGMLGGLSVRNAATTTVVVTNFTSTPVDLTNGSNGGGFVTAELANGNVVSVQYADTGTFDGTPGRCVLSGSVTAS